MMKKNLTFWLILCLSLFSSVSYAEKFIVMLDWLPNPDHAPLFIAQQKGYFKEQGLDVELIGPADSADPPKLVAAGKADVAITYQPRFLQQVDRGLPLLMIGSLVNHPLNCLVVLNNSGIHSVADLKGKKIGFSGGSLSNLTIKIMLEENGIHLKDVELINIHYDLTQALLSQRVDAVTGMMRNVELLEMALNKHPGTAFYPEKNGMPTYSELIFVTQQKNRADPRMNRFLLAVKKGIAYVKAEPDKSWKLFISAHPELNTPLNHASWNGTLLYFNDNPEKIDQRDFMNFTQFMHQNGLIDHIQPYAYYINLKE